MDSKDYKIKKKKYSYDFPEQRELSKGLRNGDMRSLVEWSGYSLPHISNMVNGKRRMADFVKMLIEKIYEQRAIMEDYAEKNKKEIAE